MKTIVKKLKTVKLNEAVFITLFLYLSMAFYSYAISNILLGLAGAFFLMGVFKKQITLKKFNWKLFIAITTPFILTVISVLNSEEIEAGLRYINLRLPIIIAPFMLFSLKIEKTYSKKAFTLLIMSALIASFVTFYNVIKYFNEDILFKTDFVYFITIIQHPYFGVYVLIALLAVLEYKFTKSKIFNVITIILLTCAIALTTSRIVYICFFVVIGLYFFSKLSKRNFVTTIALIGVLGSIFIISNKDIINKFSRSLDYEKSPRLKLWSNAFEAINKTDSYLFGIGIGDFYKEKKDVYFGEYYGGRTVGAYGYNPHSQPIEFFLTNGLFGIILLVLAFCFYLSKIKNQNIFAQSIFFIVFSFSLVECILDRQYGVQLYSILIPLVLTDLFNKKL